MIFNKLIKKYVGPFVFGFFVGMITFTILIFLFL